MGIRDSDFLLLGIAWILGLYLGSLSPWGGFPVLLLGCLAAVLRHWRVGSKRWPTAPTVKLWLMAGLMGLLASGYFWLRWPQAATNDISRLVSRLNSVTPQPMLEVTGQVSEQPQLNRNGKWRFILTAQRYQVLDSQVPDGEGPGNRHSGHQDVPPGVTTGRLYVTLPPEQLQGLNAPANRSVKPDPSPLNPGDTVTVRGWLYRPEAGGAGVFFNRFDFRGYLQGQGIFAGLAGRELKLVKPGSGWGWWTLRERIAQAQVASLGPSAGPVVSGMVLGNWAIQVPFRISDQFRRVGLSHALAASGFQVSLILGAVLALVRQLPPRQQFLAGVGALLLFGALSGFAPAVLRAVLMGVAGLVALLAKTQLRAGPILLAIAVAMLLWQPGWVVDLGFQFSFLATLGLIVSARPIARHLDWLPPTLADAVAVPLAATLWVLPLQLLVFGIFPLYGLVVNILSAPLLTVITMGGFISGLAALVWPALGTLLAWPLNLPAGILLGLVSWFSRLPGSTIATGAIGSWQVLLLYGLLLIVWVFPKWQRQWRLVAWLGLCLVILPFWQLQTQSLRVTVLPNPRLPMLVVQAPGANIVINSGGGGQQTESFLTLQGVDDIDWAIATDRRGRFQSGWLQLQAQFPLRRFSEVPTVKSDAAYRQLLQQLPASIRQQPWQPEETITLGPSQLKLLRTDPVALQMTIAGKAWLLLTEPASRRGAEDSTSRWVTSRLLPTVDVLWWVGQHTPADLIRQLQPKTVILSGLNARPHPSELGLTAKAAQVFLTEIDGAVQWTAGGGFVANQTVTSAQED